MTRPNTGRTHSTSRLAWANHCDYACAITRFPKQTVWHRLWRFFGGRVCHFNE